jgi:hypothetical protein
MTNTKMRTPDVRMLCVEEGGRPELYVVFNGLRIAQRGHPDTPHARTWISLEPGWPERRGYYLAERGLLPVFKVGERKWCACKSTLRQHIAELEADEAAS